MSSLLQAMHVNTDGLADNEAGRLEAKVLEPDFSKFIKMMAPTIIKAHKEPPM